MHHPACPYSPQISYAKFSQIEGNVIISGGKGHVKFTGRGSKKEIRAENGLGEATFYCCNHTIRGNVSQRLQSGMKTIQSMEKRFSNFVRESFCSKLVFCDAM